MSYSPNILRKLCDEFHLDFSTLKIEEHKRYENTVISGPCQEVGCNNIFSLTFRIFKRGAKCSIHLPNFDVDFLQYYCAKNKIKLIDTYEHTRARTVIKGQCVTTGCLGIFEKQFHNLVEFSTPYCIECTQKIKRQRLDQTNLEKFGTKHATQNSTVKEKTRLTNLERYGVEYVAQRIESKEKTRLTNLERYGVEYVAQRMESKEKTRQTSIQKRGVSHHSKDPKVKEKIISTNLEKYGTEHAAQNSKIKEKTRLTNLERYGVEYGIQDPKIREKINQTNLNRRGVVNPFQDPKVREKSRQTILTRYGVEHAQQNPEVHSKRVASSYSKKEFTLPSGTKIFLQGYEPYALEILLKKYAEGEIVMKAEEMPEIWWTDATEKKHRHFIDFYIPKTNTMIEVKSDYTLTRGLEASLRKQDAALKENYSYEIWIINKKKKQTAIIYQTTPSIIIKWYNKDARLKEIIETGIKLLFPSGLDAERIKDSKE